MTGHDRPRHTSQGFIQSSTTQPFVAQSSELGDVRARCLVVGVKGQPADATGALVYEFRGTGKYGAYVRIFSVAGPQTVLLDITPFNDWSLKLLGAGSTALPPELDLAWASTLAEAPDPARRETARLAVTYAANVTAPVPPGALRCWSANNVSTALTWNSFTVSSSPVAIVDSIAPAAEMVPKGTNLTPSATLTLVWEIAL